MGDIATMEAAELAAAVEQSAWWTPWAPGRAGGPWAEKPLRLDDSVAVAVLLAHLPKGWWAADSTSGEYMVVLDNGTIGRGRILGVALARVLLAHHGEVSRG